MSILGIETSCDDTAAAVLSLDGKVLGHTVSSQTDTHKEWGGVVPKLAARAHLEAIKPLVETTLQEAKVRPEDLSAIAVTTGPGLIGSLLIGTMFAKGLALTHAKPFLAINHLEGHALLPCLTHGVQFPYLLLLISGGHTQFFLVRDLGNYVLLGQSLDDALGEAFDKTARLLGLGYPGGPALEKLALEGNPDAFSFTPPLKGRVGCDFSFSGLKTAVLDCVKKRGEEMGDQTRADIAASFQKTVGIVLVDRLKNAVKIAKDQCPALETLVLSGGVAANRFLYQKMSDAAVPFGLEVVTPSPKLCTDNGIMIAYAGLLRFQKGWSSPWHTDARARWPLSEVTLQQEKDLTLEELGVQEVSCEMSDAKHERENVCD